MKSPRVNRRNFIQMGTLGIAAMGFGMQREEAGSKPEPRKRISANDKTTVGMIAVGARAQQLMENIKKIPEAEIVAVCDAYKGRVERAIARTEGRAVEISDPHDMIARKDIDCVVISTPDHLHASQFIEAAKAKKHIYAEKPLTYTVDEGVQMAEAADKNNIVVQVGSSGVSSVTSQKAREIVRSGKLGKITLIRASYNRNTPSGAWIYPIPPDANESTVNWNMFQGPAKKRPFSLERFFRWRCYTDYSGGMSTDLFVHLCNSIHYIMNVKMCRSAIGMGGLYRWKESRDVPDTLNASLEYAEGFMVSLSGTFNNTRGGGSGIQIMGTEGTLEMSGGLTFSPENVYDDNGWIVDSWPLELQKQYYEDPAVRFEERPQTREPKLLQGMESYTSEGIDSTTQHFQEWFTAIRKGGMTKENAWVGHRAAACAHLVNLSIERGGIVHWDPDRETVKKG